MSNTADPATDDRSAVVRSLFAALNRGPAALEEVLAHFAADASYRMNAWLEPHVGVDAIRAELERQATTFEDLDSEIVRLVASGDSVMVERHDRMTIGGKRITLHFAGRLTLDPDARITEWVDWFDSAEVPAVLQG